MNALFGVHRQNLKFSWDTLNVAINSRGNKNMKLLALEQLGTKLY